MDPRPLFPEIVSIHVQSTNHPPNISPETQPKSFAQALNGVCDIPYSQVPQAIIKGDKVSITILFLLQENGSQCEDLQGVKQEPT